MSETNSSKDFEFQTILNNICKGLTEDHLKKMKLLLNQDLNNRDIEGATSVEEIISMMKERDLLSVNNRGYLTDILNTMDEKTLAIQLQNLDEKIPGQPVAKVHERQLPQKRDFQRLLYQIGEDMGEGDVEKIKFLLEDEIKTNKLEKAKTSFDVLLLMQQVGFLSYEDTHGLLEILTIIKHAKCIDKLKQFNEMQRILKRIPHNVEKRLIKKHFKEDTETARKLAELMSKHHLVTMTGLLGSGKSQNAILYGCSHKEKYSDAVVWRCYATDKDAFQSSLKQLADELEISSRIAETTPTDDAIATLQLLILKELTTRSTNGFHLLIIDDVSLECKEVIETFVRCILESEKKNTKIITTTNVQYLLQEDEGTHLPVKGFSEIESIEFLSGEQHSDSIKQEQLEDFYSLAKILGNNPLGLYLAKSYMKTYHVSPKNFISFIRKKENVELIEENVMKRILHSGDKSLFSTLRFQIFTTLKDSVRPHIFNMFQMLQFLSIDDIPLLLFDFLPQNSSSSSSLVTHAFVNALQTNSFGDLDGEDETRFITIHSSISLTLNMYSNKDEKPELLKQLVWAMVLLLNKDVFLQRDLLRQQMMLPHLRSVLKHTEQKLPSINLENQMLLIFLNDLAGYAHNFGGLSKKAGEFSERAKELCLKALGVSEEEIDQNISKEIGHNCWKKEQIFDTMSAFEQFTSLKANYIHKRLKDIATLQKCDLEDFVPKFISTRYRVPDNIKLITECLGETESTIRLTEEEYKTLTEQKMAVPYDVMVKTFLPELFMSVFYTYGRRLFYIDAIEEKALAKTFLEYLFIAKEIGQCMVSENPDFRPLDSLLAERTGTLQTYFEDYDIFQNEGNTYLNAAAERFEEMFKDNNTYYVFGVKKMKPVDDDIHKTFCLKQLLRCFKKMIDMESDKDKQRQIYIDGCKHAEHILQLSDHEKWKERRSLPEIQCRVAEFYIAFNDAPKHILEKAEKLLLTVCPKYFLDKAEEKRAIQQINYFELSAAFSLLECYIRSEEKEKAVNLHLALQSYIAEYGNKRDQTRLSDLKEEIRCLDQKRE